jgi:hypothetical protein
MNLGKALPVIGLVGVLSGGAATIIAVADEQQDAQAERKETNELLEQTSKIVLQHEERFERDAYNKRIKLCTEAGTALAKCLEEK